MLYILSKRMYYEKNACKVSEIKGILPANVIIITNYYFDV